MRHTPAATLACGLAACALATSAAAAEIWWAETSNSAAGAPTGRIAYAPLAGGGAVTTYEEVAGRPTRVALVDSITAWNMSSGPPYTAFSWSVAKTGTATTIFSGTEQPDFGPRAIDATSRRIYLGTRGFSGANGLVQVAGIDSLGAPVTLYDRGANAAVGSTALDLPGNHVYWCEFPTNGVQGDTTGAVMRGSLDGSAAATTLFSNEFGCNGLAIDRASGKVYWTRYQTTAGAYGAGNPSLIRVGNLDGSGAASTLYDEGQQSSSGLALDAATGNLYWANQPNAPTFIPGTGSIRVGHVTGTPAAADLYSGLSNPNAVAVSGSGASPSPAPTPPAANPAAPAALTATVLPSRKRLVSGQQMRIGVRARNVGGSPASNVTSCLRLPSNMVVLRATGALRSGRTICFRQGTITAGSQATGVITVRAVAVRGVARTVAGTARATNVARVTATSRGVVIRPRAPRARVTG